MQFCFHTKEKFIPFFVEIIIEIFGVVKLVFNTKIESFNAMKRKPGRSLYNHLIGWDRNSTHTGGRNLYVVKKFCFVGGELVAKYVIGNEPAYQ